MAEKVEEKDKIVKLQIEAGKATEGQTASADSSDVGEATFANSCLGCHAVSAVAGNGMGPNLTTFGDRNRVAGFLEHTVENTTDWIIDPEKYKPGNTMDGKYKVTPEEAKAISEYLMTLTVEK